ncbi:TIGR02757 family protein [Bacteroidota bacterium]
MNADLKKLLQSKYLQYNNPEFIETDPIQIPHLFSKSEDIEISAFLVSTIAWGQRKTIIKNGKKLVEIMDLHPHNFIINSSEIEIKPFLKFKHRTFNGDDCIFFLHSLKNIYNKYGGLKSVFLRGLQIDNSIYTALQYFRKIFFEPEHLNRTEKHISDVTRNASAKRLNMFLRWMVRKDKNGVDFGIWDEISTSKLYIPLDIHTGTIARKLGLLKRKQNDWKAVEELTRNLKLFDPNDPVKYDYALFGMGAFEKF